MRNFVYWWVMDPVLFYKSLADDTRLKCLLLIAEQGELCVCELMHALNETQPKVSRHLALLRKNGLLQDRKHKQWVFYQLSPQLPAWASQALYLTREQNPTFIQSYLEQLSNMGERPLRQAECC